MSERGTDRPETRVTVAEYCGVSLEAFRVWRACGRARTKAAETPRDSPQIPPTGHTAQPCQPSRFSASLHFGVEPDPYRAAKDLGWDKSAGTHGEPRSCRPLANSCRRGASP